jgi:uncharacterized protein (TIGR02284 family)
MTMSADEIVQVLNDLLETCYDGMDGFRAVASTVTRGDIVTFCQARAARIDDAASELYTAIRRLGGRPAEHGHPQASVHRGWIHFRAAAIDTTDDGVLSEMETGETAAIHRYRQALSRSLPPALHDLVADQLRGVEENLEGVRQLRRDVQGSA